MTASALPTFDMVCDLLSPPGINLPEARLRLVVSNMAGGKLGHIGVELAFIELSEQKDARIAETIEFADGSAAVDIDDAGRLISFEFLRILSIEDAEDYFEWAGGLERSQCRIATAAIATAMGEWADCQHICDAFNRYHLADPQERSRRAIRDLTVGRPDGNRWRAPSADEGQPAHC